MVLKITMVNAKVDYSLDISTPGDELLYHESSEDYDTLFGVAKSYLDDPNLRAKIRNQFDCEYIEFSITKTDVDNSTTVPLYFIEFLAQ